MFTITNTQIIMTPPLWHSIAISALEIHIKIERLIGSGGKKVMVWGKVRVH